MESAIILLIIISIVWCACSTPTTKPDKVNPEEFSAYASGCIDSIKGTYNNTFEPGSNCYLEYNKGYSNWNRDNQ